jgi:predicted DsbA family dithiol-disulfide isomerase
MDSNSSESISTPPTPAVRLLADIACPWSYLTLVSLRRAFGAGLRLEWHPFVLNPRDLSRHRTRLLEAVNRYAGQLNATFRADALSQPIDSRLAHAAALAATPAEVGPVVEALFAHRFARGLPLAGPVDVTDAIAAALGTGRAQELVRTGQAHLDLVARADRAARLAGANEIPVAIVGESYVISGLQPPEAFGGLAELAAVERRLRADG